MGRNGGRRIGLFAVALVSAIVIVGCDGSKAESPAPAGSAPAASTPAPAPAAASPAAGAPAAGEHAFRGKVEVVDPAAKRLTVLNENVEGWMGPMTMAYGTDSDEVFSKIKVGDTITATVRDGDFETLYHVQIVS